MGSIRTKSRICIVGSIVLWGRAVSRMRLFATRPMSPIRIIPMKSRQGIGCTCGRRPGIRLRLQVVDMVPRGEFARNRIARFKPMVWNILYRFQFLLFLFYYISFADWLTHTSLDQSHPIPSDSISSYPCKCTDQEPEGTLSSTANHRPGPHPTVENQIRETLAPPPWYPRTLATDQPILLPLDTSNGSLTITKYGIKNFGCAGSRMYSPLEGLRVRVPVPMREKGVVWCAQACMPWVTFQLLDSWFAIHSFFRSFLSSLPVHGKTREGREWETHFLHATVRVHMV